MRISNSETPSGQEVMTWNTFIIAQEFSKSIAAKNDIGYLLVAKP